ncbi:hypothetical protein I4U23_000211 [Adineta vaga]|nr:hypothetical protein I4U23_000211 [Adineta vaga]
MSEISRMNHFEYIDEDLIDNELKCNICTKPFINPETIWSCDHTFCQTCIENIFRSSTNAACPNCLKSISSVDLRFASDIITTKLDKILVRCKYCNGINIQRGNIKEHIDKMCPKVVISCPSIDNQCRWIGPRDQLNNHMAECTILLQELLYNQLKNTMEQLQKLKIDMQMVGLEETKLFETNKKFEPLIKCIEQRCTTNENVNQELKLQVNTIMDIHKSLRLQIDNAVTNNRYLELKVSDLEDEKRQLNVQISDLTLENKGFISEINDLKITKQQLGMKTKDLQNENYRLGSLVKILRENNAVLTTDIEQMKADNHHRQSQSETIDSKQRREQQQSILSISVPSNVDERRGHE